ncbi:hypothetical protein NQ317_005611 [Molorchus minor]|uniref:Uncharacterized protein n=1 Tax=Molorchus minor TaxID=1323400 RepID=A0ABQ9K8E2_9CUCU|nr:hypothetical protein NQ317_005611 [Molorchus minor]
MKNVRPCITCRDVISIAQKTGIKSVLLRKADSLFSTAGYTFGAPTPPPGSPYSPIPVAQLELLAKGFNSNIIIQQPDYPPSPKKIVDKHCDEKCCSSLRPQKACGCQLASPLKNAKYLEMVNGCSRTNPIEWSSINVKKEPGACQVAEISTSASPIVKLEVTSPTQKGGDHGMIGNIITGNGGNIPVGIAIARQRVQQEVITSPSLPPAGLLTTINSGAQIKELDPSATGGSMAATSTMGGHQGGALLQCSDDRGTGLAAWPVGGTHNQTLTAPTLWQYPGCYVDDDVILTGKEPLWIHCFIHFEAVFIRTNGAYGSTSDTNASRGVSASPRSYHRGSPSLPTTGIEPLQQAVVWPSYPQPSSVLLPSLPSMPPPPLQLLSSASSDYLASSTTLHQHTQTHSTRLVAVTTDAKRKIPMPIPATTLIKIETDATLDQTKTLQAVSAIGSNTGTVFTDQNMNPLLTTHLIYQHPTNLLVSQTPAGHFTRDMSYATPEAQVHEEELATVQDASNQTDSPICSEDDNTTHTVLEITESKRPDTVHEKEPESTEEFRDGKTPIAEEGPIFAEVEIVHPTTTTAEEQPQEQDTLGQVEPQNQI